MGKMLGKKYTLRWDTDKKGVTCGWCTLSDPHDILTVAEIVAGFSGRVTTISAMMTSKFESPKEEEPKHIEIKYHLYFDSVNLTVTITLPKGTKKVDSITSILKSADWHEREMQDFYNLELQGHPNPRRLFLDESIQMTDNTMIPLSEALNGASTNTLWERIMRNRSREDNINE